MARIEAGDTLMPKPGFNSPERLMTGADGKRGLNTSSSDSSSEGGFKMKKELGLLDGVAIIVGVIVGAGIFVSPKGVLLYSGSIGQSIVVWIMCGLLSMVGALCYAELGTMIPKSGGDYAYIGVAFGPLPAFLYLWVALLVIVPTGNAITALTFAQYLLQPFRPNCDAPVESVQLLAAVITCVLTAINCYNVKWVTRVTDIFTGTKILALLVIVGAGIYYLAGGNTEQWAEPMRGSLRSPGLIALAFYNGLFSYSGWNYLNFVTEELKDPFKNLPKAICISMPLVTIIYVVTNIAYFTVLSTDEMLSSEAVAVTFGDKMLGYMSWIMPFFVACSTFGSLNGGIFASSRLFFVGARNGHLPAAISLINVNCLTPVPSLIFLCILSLVLLFINDVYALINYVSYVEALFTLMSISGLLWLRYKQPKTERPIRVNLILPIIFMIVCSFLVISSCYQSPIEVGVGTAIILSGIPVYYATIHRPVGWLTRLSQNLPKAICISMPLVTIIYVVTNIAYFTVLSTDEMLSSEAVAVTFGDKMLGYMSWIMPFFVACSTFGSLNGGIFASSRLFFVGARNGHLPAAISLINVNCLTPVPSLIFLCILSLVLLFINDVYALINYVSYVEALFTLMSISGLLWLRYKQPKTERPIRVNLILPIIFMIVCSFLVISSCYQSPIEVGVGTAIILSGIPVYYATIHRPVGWLTRLSQSINLWCSKFFLCMPNQEKAN